jgi:chemotaxis protein histidine kinase CheA
MGDENKELLDLLEKLKKMEPAGESRGNVQPPSEKAALEDLLPKKEKTKEAPKAEKKAAPKKETKEKKEKKPAPRPMRMGVITSDIFKKIADIERDIRTKEEGINLDIEKLDALVEAIGQREAELSDRESVVADKDMELTRQLEDLRKIKAQLQSVLK